MKKLSLILIILLSSLISLSGIVIAHTGDDDYGHHMMGGFMGTYGMGMWGMGIFGWIFSLLIIVIFILLIAWLIKQIQKK